MAAKTAKKAPAARADGFDHTFKAIYDRDIPWESDDVTLSMAITLVNSDGWAIEHTNLGTVTLTDLGHDHTQIALVAEMTEHPEQERLTPLLSAFGRQIQERFETKANDAGRPS